VLHPSESSPDGVGPQSMPFPFRHWQQVTGAPATEQMVSVHEGCVTESQSNEINEPVNVPDPLYVVVDEHE